MTVTEKVAYIKGLMDASELNEDAKETKIIKAIVDALSEIAELVTDLEDGYSDLSEQVDAIDEDLDALEQDFYEDDDDDDDEDDEDLFEITCASCGDTLMLDEETLLTGTVECPGCGTTLELDVHYDDECDCDDEDCDSCKK